jgi:hypothetical protein
MAISSVHRGFYWDKANSELEIYVNGTKVVGSTNAALTITPATTITGALTCSANVTLSLTLTAGADGVGSDGEQLTSGGAAAECDWAAAASLLRFKNILEERVDENDVLATLVSTPVYDFKYKERTPETQANPETRVMGTGDTNTVYTGVVAEDLPEVMHYNGKILNPVNTFGYTVLAIKALENRVRELEGGTKI